MHDHVGKKNKSAKTEAMKREYNMTNRKKFGEYLKKNPPGTMKGDRKAMFEHNRQEWDK